ncbi:outer membrane protein assembly factor BamD [Candidatus Erwinia haradaeae]|uniref:Outer membrane protein assembly factor BamD n=1 Tax=Candidatus Erwinia haradaeae TaxID=1922217 RepID=A0A451D2G7_9GAMM|nr:outer membrane protein assembly factor BamD [Candidatus Erwinia haradaeae]VFP79814.1 Outer membrane protein assembly factor BamD [Candidatus Erwinia haradaeae]
MTNKKYLLISVILNLWLCGCSQSTSMIHDNHSLTMFTSAEKKIKDGKFKEAIVQLESMNTHDILSPYFKQMQIYLIYAYYKNGDLTLALEAIDHFIRLYPDHKNLDYVIYIRGLTYMAQDQNPIQNFFKVNRLDRDPLYRISAFNSFSQLIQNYPNSQYIVNARKNLLYLKERQAYYNLSVAEFYAQHQAYIAVVKRVEKMITDYPDTQALRKALPLMENAYRKLHLYTQAQQIKKIIIANAV